MNLLLVSYKRGIVGNPNFQTGPVFGGKVNSGKVYSVVKLEARPKTEGYVKVVKDKRTLPTKHANIHPWKKTESNGFRYDSRDKELYEGLFNSTIAWETE